MHNANGYGFIYEAQKSYNEMRKRSTEGCEGDEFFVTDTLQEAREVMESIDRCTIRDYRSFDERIVEAERFCEEHNRLPQATRRRDNNYTPQQVYEDRMYGFLYANRQHPRVEDLYAKYCRVNNIDFESRLQDLMCFCAEHNRMPGNGKNVSKTEKSLNGFVNANRKNSIIISLREKYKQIQIDAEFHKAEEWCMLHNRLPSQIKTTKNGEMTEEQKEEMRLVRYLYSHKNDERVIALRKKYESWKEYGFERKVSILKEYGFERKVSILKEYVAEHNRLPVSCKKDKLQMGLVGFMSANKDNEQIIAIKSQFAEKDPIEKVTERNRELFKEFCHKYGRLPLNTNKEERKMASYYKTHSDDPVVIECKRLYYHGWKYRTEELLNLYEEACKELGHHPSQNDPKYRSIIDGCRLWLKDDPRYLALREQYPSSRSIRVACERKNIDERIKELKEFIKIHGHRPKQCNDDKYESSLASFYAYLKYKLRSKYQDVIAEIEAIQ